ncbi:recombinase family protein [Qipengyuania citrea]|jgi:DNA invertase Pin-like site-specific DNA recombinase|uniref:recombinase family protein n=1 Tax=Qipengyuania citrea TaxID=225971 RepID=UPI00067F2A06|nr:recombinase family protein [Qipengyuania citrea]
MTDLKPAAGYIRVAPKPQADTSKLVEQQRREIERDAARRGYVVVHWYQDSGPELSCARQPDLRCLIDDSCSRTRPYLAIFVSSLSRLSRDTLENEAYRSKLQRHGLRVLSAECADELG